MVRRDPMSFLQNLLGVLRSSILCLRLIRRLRPDYLLTGNATFSYYILPALMFSRLRLVYRHGDDLAEHSFFHRLLNSALFRRVDSHVANCHYLANNLSLRYPQIKAVIIYNLPVFLLFNDKVPKIFEDQKDRLHINIIYVGQIAVHKGILLLLDAFTRLAEKYPMVLLTCIGEVSGVGKNKEANLPVLDMLHRAIESYPNRIFLLGHQGNPDTYYRQAHIHVCPSIYQEPSANVIFEAKFFGLPSVVFDVGGLPELVSHKLDGYICDEINSESLEKGLSFFIEDNEVRMNAGRTARQSIDSRFGVNRFIFQWQQVFSQLES